MKLRFIGGPLGGQVCQVLLPDAIRLASVVGRFEAAGHEDQAYRVNWSRGEALHKGPWQERHADTIERKAGDRL